MTKAERIRALFEEGRLSDVKIAAAVGCRVEYVRAVRHRMENLELSRAYARDFYWLKRVATPEARERYNAYHRQRRAARKAIRGESKSA